MEYEEYLKCADKHLKSCQQILEGLKHNEGKTEDALLDVWYLSGYIFEGFTIYAAYKHYGWNPQTKVKDIQTQYDKIFSKKTNIDFYRHRIVRGKEVLADIEIKYSIQGHCFQEIINNRLKNIAKTEGFPVLGNAPLDKDVETLIRDWKPEIRYWYKSTCRIKIPELNQNLLERLLNTCKELYKKMIEL